MKRIALFVLLAPAISYGQIYKCTGPDGHTTFSGSPCSGAKQVERINVQDNHIGGQFANPAAAPPKGSSERERVRRKYDKAIELLSQPKQVCKNISRTQLRTLIIRSQIVPGMKLSDALKSWGTPYSVNGSQHAYFWGSTKGSFFYIKDGCVASVSGSYRGPSAVR